MVSEQKYVGRVALRKLNTHEPKKYYEYKKKQRTHEKKGSNAYEN